MDLSAIAQLPAAVIWTAAFILGAMIGSFLNVVILRLPPILEHDWRGQAREILGLDAVDEQRPPGLVVAGSHCPQCKTKIKPWHNLPIVGYLLLRGRCHACSASISVQYPLVELLTALITLAVVAVFGLTWQAGAAVLLSWTLIAASGIDFRTQLLPDQLTLPLLWFGLLLNLNGVFASLPDAVIGAAAGYLVLWSVYWAFKLITGKEGMGYGDFKLLAALGAWMGWQALPQIVLLSSLVGVIIGGGWMALSRKGRGQPMPFGPYLAMAGWIALLFGDAITQWYFSFFTSGY